MNLNFNTSYYLLIKCPFSIRILLHHIFAKARFLHCNWGLFIQQPPKVTITQACEWKQLSNQTWRINESIWKLCKKQSTKTHRHRHTKQRTNEENENWIKRERKCSMCTTIITISLKWLKAKVDQIWLLDYFDVLVDGMSFAIEFVCLCDWMRVPIFFFDDILVAMIH